MIRRMVLLSALTCAVMGCAAPTPTVVPTDVPPTATVMPTAEPTAATLTKSEYAEAAFKQFKRSADAQSEALKLLRDPKWGTDDAARQELLAVMAIPEEVSQIFKATVPPPGAEAVHAGMVEQVSYLASAMGKIKDAMTALEAGDTAAAQQALKDQVALMNSASQNSAAALGALGALRNTP